MKSHISMLYDSHSDLVWLSPMNICSQLLMQTYNFSGTNLLNAK